MTMFKFAQKTPQVDPTAFIAAGACVIGDVIIGAESSLWYNSILRGDVFPVRVGKRTNIQDLSVGHVTSGTHALHIGDEVTIGHRVIIHGCTLNDRCLIGMGAVIMDGAEVGEESIIGAGAVVTPNTKIPPRSMALGTPARVTRELTPEEIAFLSISAENYVQLALRHQTNLSVFS